MCGRYNFTYTDEIYDRFEIYNRELKVMSHYNVAPSNDMPVVVKRSPNRLIVMQWGLIPYWSRDKRTLINARAEGLETSKTFSKPLQFNRCIVVASGFYEWKRAGKEKIPFYIKLKGEDYIGFAGLILKMKDINGNETEAYVIITTAPNEIMEPIHNRMPVILRKEDEEKWLNPDTTEPEHLLPLLASYPANKMEAYPVSTRVNSPANDTPDLIKPA